MVSDLLSHFFCSGELMWCNGQASEYLVGPHLAVSGIIFAAEYSDWFGISSSIRVAYTVPVPFLAFQDRL